MQLEFGALSRSAPATRYRCLCIHNSSRVCCAGPERSAEDRGVGVARPLRVD